MSDLAGQRGTVPKRGEDLSGTDMYHQANFHADRCHRRRDICNRTEKKQQPIYASLAFVTSRVDYCNVVFAGAPKIITNKLQRVLNSAARVVSGTRKFDRGLRQLMHTELHWLDVPEQRVSSTTRCDHTPMSVRFCSPVSSCVFRSSLDNCL